MGVMYICGGSDFHPYECSHDKYCIHCTNGVARYHNPMKCWLCCDGDPKKNKPHQFVKEKYHQPIRVKDYSHRYQKVKVNKFIQEILAVRGGAKI